MRASRRSRGWSRANESPIPRVATRESSWVGRLRERALYNDLVMIDALLKKIFGTKHERDVKRMMPTVVAINAFEPSLQPLDEAGLRAKSDEFRKRLAGSETVDDVQSEAFAVCREVARSDV